MGKNKVVVVGIDGGTFDIINPLIKKGELRSLKALMDGGSHGYLQSQIPPYTWVAIASFLTGTNPGKHGVFDFTINNHNNYGNYNMANSSNIKSPTFLDLLNKYDKQLISFLFPLSYPPQEIKGAIVSKVRPEIMKKKGFTFPDSLAAELIRELGGLDFEKIPFNLAAKKEFTSKDSEFFGRKLKELAYKFEKERLAIRYVMNKFTWDVCMLYINNTDLLQHWFWRFMDEGHHLYNPQNRFHDAIYDGYRVTDNFIGELLAGLDDDTTVIVFSDHGFGPLYYKFYLNRWLIEKGLLVLKTDNFKKWQTQFVDLKKICSRVGLKGVAKRLPPIFSKVSVPVLKWVDIPLKEVVDWTKTKAYGTSMGININLKGREAEGVVERSEYAALVQHIRECLKRLSHPLQNDTPVIEEVFQKEEIYHGPFTEYGTDIMFTFKKELPSQIFLDISADEVFKRTDKEELLSGSHFSCSRGIFLIKGPQIKANNIINDANIMDVLPTVLYTLGLPIHPDIDGKVLTDVFEESYLNQNPVQYTTAPHKIKREGFVFAEEEKAAIQKELRQLGYIE